GRQGRRETGEQGNHVFDEVARLLAKSCTDSEHPLDEPAAPRGCGVLNSSFGAPARQRSRCLSGGKTKQNVRNSSSAVGGVGKAQPYPRPVGTPPDRNAARGGCVHRTSPSTAPPPGQRD